jgi:6-pyruvoyltetrahydropterin/6-carboxytetrahydropterin synthase
MSDLRITKEFSFEMAHALKHYSGKCENIHGHTYHLSVTVKGPVISAADAPKDGMVMDFGDLKKIVHERILDLYDHALVLNENDQRKDGLQKLSTKIILTPFQPTSENLILDFVARVRESLQEDVKLVQMKLRETATSFAEWYAEDNP